jgi:hypothetical protein
MFKQDELIKFIDDEKEKYYIVLESEDQLDFSIFSSEEW